MVILTLGKRGEAGMGCGEGLQAALAGGTGSFLVLFDGVVGEIVVVVVVVKRFKADVAASLCPK